MALLWKKNLPPSSELLDSDRIRVVQLQLGPNTYLHKSVYIPFSDHLRVRAALKFQTKTTCYDSDDFNIYLSVGQGHVYAKGTLPHKSSSMDRARLYPISVSSSSLATQPLHTYAHATTVSTSQKTLSNPFCVCLDVR